MSRFAFADELAMLRDEIRNTGSGQTDILAIERYATGVVDGYYRAGAINACERDGARLRIRGQVTTRLAVASLERAARAEGLA